jgi:hypothetical protein
VTRSMLLIVLLVVVPLLIVLVLVGERVYPDAPVVASTTSTSVDAGLVPAVTIEAPTTTTTTTTVATTSTSMPRSQETAPPAANPTGDTRSISSTGYCETGRMSNGEYAHDGAVSSHVLARGTSWRVLTGPYAGRVLIVKDTGPLAFFDIAMPGRCGEAIQYGRRQIQIEQVAA